MKYFSNKVRGLGHLTYFEILRPLYISGLAAAIDSKLGSCIQVDG